MSLDLKCHEITQVIKGSDRNINFVLLGPHCEPLDLTGVLEIKVGLKKVDGTTLTKTKTSGGVQIVNAVAGKIVLNLTPADTNSLAPNLMDVEIKIESSTNKITIVNIEKAFNVVPEIYAGL